MTRALFLAGSAIVLGGSLSPSALEAQSSFPHEKHAIFFADCGACHGGVTSEGFDGVYPETATCAACHDGSTAPEIDWAPPDGPRASNLGFRHEPHGFDCATCHIPEGGEDLSLMMIPRPSTCLSCHAPQAEGHLSARGMCQTCHVPVVESSLSADDVAGFPAPASHRLGDFAITHGAAAVASAADCAICHDRSSRAARNPTSRGQNPTVPRGEFRRQPRRRRFGRATRLLLLPLGEHLQQLS
jgi:hypothetical protein